MRFFFVQTIGQRGCGWFVDDPQNFETRDLTCVFGRLTLCVVEVCRHGDDRLGDVFAKVCLGGFLHLTQSEGRDLRWRVFVALSFNPCVAVAAVDDGERHHLFVFFDSWIIKPTTDQTLHTEYGVVRVGDSLTFRRLADQTLFVGECDDRWRGAVTFGVFDHAWLRAVHDCDTGVCGPEVNSNYFTHFISLLT